MTTFIYIVDNLQDHFSCCLFSISILLSVSKHNLFNRFMTITQGQPVLAGNPR